LDRSADFLIREPFFSSTHEQTPCWPGIRLGVTELLFAEPFIGTWTLQKPS
jgi:hypothetical protein